MHAVCKMTVVSAKTRRCESVLYREGGDEGGQSSKKLDVENARLCESNGADIECEMLPEGRLKAPVKPTCS